jgi:hypothetical protein
MNDLRLRIAHARGNVTQNREPAPALLTTLTLPP